MLKTRAWVSAHDADDVRDRAEFQRETPRAAVIFDNLHMMHDIISDILIADTIPRSGSAASSMRSCGVPGRHPERDIDGRMAEDGGADGRGRHDGRAGDRAVIAGGTDTAAHVRGGTTGRDGSRG
jgi:hypothetical protein